MAKQHDPSPNELHQPPHDPAANRENQDHDFPGYPHHPASEDLLNSKSEAEQVDVNVEDFSRNTWTAARDQAVRHLGEEKRPDLASNDLDDVLPGQRRTATTAIDPDADVTEEDLALLGDPNLDQDGGDDELMDNYQGLDDTDLDGEPLNEYAGTISATGKDLDMPDEELENAGTGLDPAEDEENDYFSLGADKDSLEDDQAGDNF